jgi:hypothetical protein
VGRAFGLLRHFFRIFLPPYLFSCALYKVIKILFVGFLNSECYTNEKFEKENSILYIHYLSSEKVKLKTNSYSTREKVIGWQKSSSKSHYLFLCEWIDWWYKFFYVYKLMLIFYININVIAIKFFFFLDFLYVIFNPLFGFKKPYL